MHTDFGALSLVVWYRPPGYAEINSILNLVPEHDEFSGSCVGTIVVGDVNVHHKPWLKFSNGISPEGRELFDVCCRLGFHQCVQKPTRGEYLLDLVLTDV